MGLWLPCSFLCAFRRGGVRKHSSVAFLQHKASVLAHLYKGIVWEHKSGNGAQVTAQGLQKIK